MLFGRSSLYIIRPQIFNILNGSSFAKSNFSLGFVVRINVTFVFGVFYRWYTLFLFLRVSSQAFFLLASLFIILLKKIKSYFNFFYSLWILSTFTTTCDTNSSHRLVSSKTSASNPLFAKNRIILMVLCSKVLYVSIPIGSSLTQLVY